MIHCFPSRDLVNVGICSPRPRTKISTQKFTICGLRNLSSMMLGEPKFLILAIFVGSFLRKGLFWFFAYLRPFFFLFWAVFGPFLGRFWAVFWGGSNFFGHWTLGGSPKINFNCGLFHFLAIFWPFLLPHGHP